MKYIFLVVLLLGCVGNERIISLRESPNMVEKPVTNLTLDDLATYDFKTPIQNVGNYALRVLSSGTRVDYAVYRKKDGMIEHLKVDVNNNSKVLQSYHAPADNVSNQLLYYNGGYIEEVHADHGAIVYILLFLESGDVLYVKEASLYGLFYIGRQNLDIMHTVD